MPDKNWEAMDVVLRQTSNLLKNSNDVHSQEKAVERAWQMFHMGPTILPTPGVDDSFQLWED